MPDLPSTLEEMDALGPEGWRELIDRYGLDPVVARMVRISLDAAFAEVDRRHAEAVQDGPACAGCYMESAGMQPRFPHPCGRPIDRTKIDTLAVPFADIGPPRPAVELAPMLAYVLVFVLVFACLTVGWVAAGAFLPNP